LEKKALEYIGHIDDLGGAVAAIERGYMQREIQNAAFIYQREIETRQRIIVGVNQFTAGAEPPAELLKVNPALEEQQKRALHKVRAERDAAAARQAQAQVECAARDGQNLMPAIVGAVRAWCTIGEISDAMRRVFGEYRPVDTL
ncbi:MAG: methylmalonyl-CoA mutase family protein, partial [Candidatus Binataceae bacterium]